MLEPMPPFVPPSAATGAAFLAICTTILIGWVLAVRHTSGTRTAGVVAVAWVVWLGATSATAVAIGQTRSLPLFLGFFAVSNLTALGVALSPLGGALARLPLAVLVGFQVFRLPLEIVLHAWADAGVIPVTMSWSGMNIDVVAGVVCGIAGLRLWQRPDARGSAWVANIVGTLLLANVAFTAVHSSPLPFAIYDAEPPLMLAMHVPWVWIVPVCVGSALVGHVVTFRRLLGR